MPTAKSANLSRGQRYFWLHHHQLPPDARHDTHIVLDLPLPEGVTLVQVRSVLNYLVRRHEALRTTFGPDADGWPEQRVHPPAALPVRRATTDADGGPSPAETVRELTVADFDLAADWPIRACVVTGADVPRRLVLVLNHVAFDDGSVQILLTELEALLAGAVAGRPAVLPPVRRQPTDLARSEAARPESQREDQAAYWRGQIARLPADHLGRRRFRAAEPPASCSASLTSPRMLEAARTIAARHRVWPSAVHMTVYAAVMAAYCGADLIPFWLFTSHRGDEPDTDVLTCMFAPVLMTAELTGDPTFGEVLQRVSAQLDAARSHAGAAYDEVVELMALQGFGNGRPLRVETEFNLLNYASRSCGSRRTRFAWNREPTAWARSGSDAYFRVYDWADGVTIVLRAAAAVMRPPEVERFLRGYEELVVANADEGTDPRLSEIRRLLDFPPPVSAPPPLDDDAHVGPPGPRGPGAAEAERALLTAVATVNRLSAVDPADSYPVAGGRALRVPQVLAVLHELGWAGLTLHQLTGVRSLRALAAGLEPVLAANDRAQAAISGP